MGSGDKSEEWAWVSFNIHSTPNTQDVTLYNSTLLGESCVRGVGVFVCLNWSAEEGSSDTDSHLGIFLRVRGERRDTHTAEGRQRSG